MSFLLDVYEWVDYRGRRTRKYWQWRTCEQLGLPWPNNEGAEDWHSSTARRYTKFRNAETGTKIYFVAEAGSPSPQVLIQIQPFYWGFAVQVGEGYLAWRIGPVAVKFGYGPLAWQKRFWRGYDTP